MMRRAGRWNLRRVLIVAGMLGALALLSAWTGAAQAAACDTTWTNTSGVADWSNPSNWDNGVPSSTSNACITKPGNYTVTIIGEPEQAASLTLGASSGIQTLAIEGNANSPSQLTLGGNSSIGSGGAVTLTSVCTTGCSNPVASTLTVGASATLTNGGTITSDMGQDQGAGGRVLEGDVTNDGTVDVNAPLTYRGGVSGGTLDNFGTISLANGQVLTVPAGEQSTVVNDTGGQITNNGGTGELFLAAGTSFDQAGGTTNPDSADPPHPAVAVGDDPATTLQYTGTGASAILAQNDVTLKGSLAQGQNLVVDGVNSGGCPESLVTSATGFTNAATITLTGPCESGIRTTSGQLTNNGTIVTRPGAIGRELGGDLLNKGRLNINGPTAFTGSGKTLTQTAGTTTISPNQVLDLTQSGGNFVLKGGLLSSPGSNSSRQGTITGSLLNIAGNVAPGSTTTPGDMTVSGHYSQGARGRLTAVIDGTKVGTTYSQLGVEGGSTLGGTLDIVTHSGFTPTSSNLFTVLGGSTDAGKFARVIGQFLAGGTLGYKLLYDAKDMTLQAAPAARLTLKRAGSGKGTVTSSPAGINCGPTCAASFFKPQTVTLTEHPASGSKFAGWSGACTGKTTTCKVKMTKARAVTATFS